MTSTKLSPIRRKSVEAGRRIEREAIVDWLRKDRPYWDLNPLADEIERGDHLK